MTNQKLYALKTSDTGEWVRYEDNSFIVLSEQEDNSDLESLLAIKNTGKPCEWVEVYVIEAKGIPPESELVKDCPYLINARMAWLDGINYCLRYLGVG